VNHFADALRIVAESDLLTCVPSGFLGSGDARALVEKQGLVIRELPFETEKLIYKLIWHERLHIHPAHQWFRSLVVGTCAIPEGTTMADTALQGPDEARYSRTPPHM
jgi:DNA-binding transcriptional LysR family regulator